MKSLLTSIFFLTFFTVSLNAQFYGVSFDTTLAASNGGWSSSGINGVFWTTTDVAAPAVGGINTTPMNGSGFAYTETNGSFSGQATAYLESPCFDLMDSIDRVQFFYQIVGNVDSFRLEVSYDDGISYTETVLDIPIATYSDWERENTIGLSIMGSVRFRFVVVFNSGSSGIVTLDQLQLFGTNNGELTDCADIDCVENLTLNNATLSEEFYRAKKQLSSNAIIASNDDVTFTAGDQIILKEGFVASNTTFTARIEDCNSVGVAFLEYYERPDPLLAEEIAYFDRFGNGYSPQELELEVFNNDDVCYAGIFQLNFKEGVTTAEQDVTCAVFAYLDSLITTSAPDSSIAIAIYKSTLDNGVLASGSPRWSTEECGIATSTIEKAIIGADKRFFIDHGRIDIAKDFENLFFTDLNNSPDVDGVDKNKYHFYTVMLHEALHVLGFASLVDENSTPLDITGSNQIIEGQAFSRYDQFLFSLSENDFLLAPDPMSDCCDAHAYQLTNNPASGCSISFRDGMSDVATVDGTARGNRLNLLSHFNITCDNGIDQYVMHPLLPRLGDNVSTNGGEAIRTRLTCAELQALYLIGYDVANAINNQGCTLPSNGACDVVVLDDIYVFDPLSNGESLDTTISIAEIVANDFLTSGYDQFAYTVDTNPNFIVSDDGTDLLITINAAGTYTINYTLTACGMEALCDEGTITIILSGCATLDCGNCNILSIGDFECLQNVDSFRYFSRDGLLLTRGCEVINGEDCGYRFDSENNTVDFSTLGRSISFLNATCGNISILPVPSLSNERAVGMGVVFFENGDLRAREGIVLRLDEEIAPSETIDISMFAQSRDVCMILSNFNVQVSFLSTAFQDDETRARTERVFINQNDAWSGLSPNWQIPIQYEIEPNETPTRSAPISITKPATDVDNWAYIVIYTNFDFQSGDPVNAYALIDDIQVVKQKEVDIVSNSTITNVCQNGEFTVNYELFNDHCSASDSLTIELEVPTGLTLEPLGFFSQGNPVKIGSFNPEELRFIQARLSVNEQASIGQDVDLVLKVIPDGCYQTSSDTTVISFIDSPFSSLTKTFTSVNDTFTFDITVCNSVEDTIRNVQVTDNIPSSFQLIDAGGFTLQSSTNSTFLQLDTILPPASGGMDACLTFTYTAVALEDFCPSIERAIAQIPESACGEVSDEVYLEDPDLPPLNADFSFNVNCVNGITNFTSSTSSSGIIHFWDFGDGSTDTTANPMHTFTTNQTTYIVTHKVSNICGDSTVFKGVSYTPCNPTFECTCTDNTMIGNPPSGTTNISQAGISLNYDNVDSCLQIGGRLIIDTDFTLNGGEVLLEPNTEIVVSANQTLTITNANLQSCENYMWQGITLGDGANLVLEGNTISDAIQAVKTRNQPTVELVNNTFDRNYIAIDILDIPIIEGISGNIFSCSDTLNSGLWGLYGARVTNGLLFMGDFNPNVTEQNVFKDLEYGIVSSFSVVSIADAVFENLRYDTTTPPVGLSNSIGLFADMQSQVAVTQCTLRNVNKGIVNVNGFTDIYENTIDTVNYGIVARNNFSFNAIRVEDNNIKAARRGVQFQNMPLGQSSEIKNNIIEMDYFDYDYTGQASKDNTAYGIEIALFPLTDRLYSSIEDNTITLTSINEGLNPQMIGIGVGSSSGIDILRNNIALEGDTLPSFDGFDYGIHLVDGDDILVSEDTVSNTANYVVGIGGTATTNSSYCCNVLSGRGENFRFSGSCRISSINLNEIGQPSVAGDYGLVCTNGTDLSQQLYIDIVTDVIRHSGNKWFTDDYSATGALHLGEDEEIENSEFVVGDTTINSAFYPAATPLGAVIPSDFFSTSTFDELPPCDQNIECFPDQGIVSTDDGRIARLARQNAYTQSPYREMLNWEANAHLLALLKSDSDLLGQDAKVDSFYAVQRNTMLEALGDIKIETRQSFNRHDFNIPTLLQQSEQIKTALTELITLRAAYQAATDLEERQNIIDQQRAIAQSLRQYRKEQNILLEQVREIIQRDVNLVELENSTLFSSDLLPKNEQIVNSIHFAYLQNPNIRLPSLQIEQLYGVANQCPKLGGRVVYRARLLYEILVESSTWDNQETCEIIEERSPTKPIVENGQLQSMNLYPNPTYHSVTVELDKAIVENQDIQFQIYTLTGKMALEIPLQDQSSTILLQHLSEGLYFCSLFVDGVQQQTKRLVIIK